MKYRIEWRQGNGYKCSCCRRVTSCTATFDEEAEAREKIEELKKQRESDDSEVNEVTDIKLLFIERIEDVY